MSSVDKWIEALSAALEGIKLERERCADILPRDQSDMSQWKTYYQERVSRLENEALNIAARMVWTNAPDKKSLMKEYIEELNKLVQGIGDEEKLHVVESYMSAAVRAEARRLRQSYPQFF